MTFIDKLDTVEIAHAWQAHRTLCLKLAIKAGTPNQDVVSRANEISAYIITRSELENNVK